MCFSAAPTTAFPRETFRSTTTCAVRRRPAIRNVAGCRWPAGAAHRINRIHCLRWTCPSRNVGKPTKSVGSSAGCCSARPFPTRCSTRDANDTARVFWEEKIRAVVDDPQVADWLIPTDHPIGTKRICTDDNYFQTFNRENVDAGQLAGDADRADGLGRGGDLGRSLRPGRAGAGDRLRRDDRVGGQAEHRGTRWRNPERRVGVRPGHAISGWVFPAFRTCSTSAARAAHRSWPTWHCIPSCTSTGSPTRSATSAHTEP